LIEGTSRFGIAGLDNAMLEPARHTRSAVPMPTLHAPLGDTKVDRDLAAFTQWRPCISLLRRVRRFVHLPNSLTSRSTSPT